MQQRPWFPSQFSGQALSTLLPHGAPCKGYNAPTPPSFPTTDRQGQSSAAGHHSWQGPCSWAPCWPWSLPHTYTLGLSLPLTLFLELHPTVMWFALLPQQHRHSRGLRCVAALPEPNAVSRMRQAHLVHSPTAWAPVPVSVARALPCSPPSHRCRRLHP